MIAFISAFLAFATGLLSIPVVVFFAEVIASLIPQKDEPAEVADPDTSRRVAVVVPAHDESIGILPTIHDIALQLTKRDRLLVVADNCTDDTAVVAGGAGAEVLARNDSGRIGKGYALAWAIDHLRADPPDFVVFIDADCRIQGDMIGRLRNICDKLRRPVQARYLMKMAANSPIDHSFAEFAWAIRNWARPLGLRNLGCPTQLMGTGMMFPWKLISTAPLANGHLVEDLKLGLDLAAAGKAPQFFPSVVCTSEFPVSAKGTDSQRQRWVGGHIGMILQTLPRYLWLAITGFNFDLFVLALDLAVPPLSLLGILIVGMFVLTSLAWLLGFSSTAWMVAAGNLLAFTLAVMVAWLKFGRKIMPAHALLSIGAQIGQRLKLFSGLLFGKTASDWIRTDREKPK
jgi:cellulose synthase/poly-beta-1,6-N-acetylglucosamine synthase-like glycosyltransferase